MLCNCPPVTASVEPAAIAPFPKPVIFLLDTSIPLPLIVIVVPFPLAGLVVKVTPVLVIATSVLPAVPSPPLCTVKPFVASPDMDVKLVTSDFKLTLYLLPSVPSPSTVVFVPSSSFDGAAPPPPAAALSILSFNALLNVNLYLRVTPFSVPFSVFSLLPVSTTMSSLSSTRVSLAFTIKLLNVTSFPSKSFSVKVFGVTVTLSPACT